jgi:mannose-1-phosphate guanylyltransferase/mannose-6-phosphate isomerase
MRNKGAQLIIEGSSKQERPWGHYIVLEEDKDYTIKKVIIQPGQKLSLQLHYHRSEHWIVVSGFAEVDLNDNQIMLRKGESMFVPIGVKHQLKNPGIIPLEVLEVQIGEYLEEDDIVRFPDEEDYFSLKQCEPYKEEINEKISTT